MVSNGNLEPWVQVNRPDPTAVFESVALAARHQEHQQRGVSGGVLSKEGNGEHMPPRHGWQGLTQTRLCAVPPADLLSAVSELRQCQAEAQAKAGPDGKAKAAETAATGVYIALFGEREPEETAAVTPWRQSLVPPGAVPHTTKAS